MLGSQQFLDPNMYRLKGPELFLLLRLLYKTKNKNLVSFFFFFFCIGDLFFHDTDSSWRDDKQRQLRDHGREKEQQQQDEEYGDDSSSAAAAEQQRIQAQEMAAYHKRLASLSLPEAQRLTQIDLKHSDSHVTAQVGHPAYLKCAVSNQGDQLVSRIIPHSLFTTN
jgi:hypothetical protein